MQKNYRRKLLMHYKHVRRYEKIIILMLLVVASCCPKSSRELILPFDKIKVLVLSKYKLKSIAVSAVNATVFLPEKTLNIPNGEIFLRADKSDIILRYGSRKFTADYLSIISDGHIKVTYKSGNKQYARIFKDELSISSHDSVLEIVNNLYVEDFVCSAAIAELGPFISFSSDHGALESWQSETLKAVEIALRTYLFYFKDRHPSENYQFCDLTHCAFFPGIITDAKPLTPGKVLLDADGNYIPAYFHSTCGGVLDGPESYWPRHSYHKNFRRGDDTAASGEKYLCSASPHYRWKAFIKLKHMEEITGHKNIERIVLNFSGNKRIKELIITDNSNKTYILPVSNFLSATGKLLGWHVVKSNLFSITKSYSGWQLNGKGLGHGIGLCQWGAQELAKHGKTYKMILDHYYNNPDIVQGVYAEK